MYVHMHVWVWSCALPAVHVKFLLWNWPKINGLLTSIAVAVGVRDSAEYVICTYSYVCFSGFEFPWLCKFSFPLVVVEMFTAC